MPIYVNQTEIDDNAVFTEMQYHSAENMEEARNAAAQALVVRELMQQEARRLGLLKGERVEEEHIDAALMQLVEEAVAVPEATTDVCRSYYDSNVDRFRTTDADGQVMPFGAVEDKIRDYLHTRSVREGIRSYILNLAENAKITGFDLAASL
ncbi:hypothetical protein GCM10017044_15490 [Kordiimonas sediminis]|uniref:Peptidylprolyl isomerase n=1 Tax=Kordiimonas sediminis TaxID=1735581 RepID=A0A919AS99_9PROT|nr:hypothetical protein [Kordiimonas sediminis]GHF22268.1 hypothetical protein GCM10017044_15490 [Kordiimonas sediminis]